MNSVLFDATTLARNSICQVCQRGWLIGWWIRRILHERKLLEGWEHFSRGVCDNWLRPRTLVLADISRLYDFVVDTCDELLSIVCRT